MFVLHLNGHKSRPCFILHCKQKGSLLNTCTWWFVSITPHALHVHGLTTSESKLIRIQRTTLISRLSFIGLSCKTGVWFLLFRGLRNYWHQLKHESAEFEVNQALELMSVVMACSRWEHIFADLGFRCASEHNGLDASHWSAGAVDSLSPRGNNFSPETSLMVCCSDYWWNLET